MSDGFSRFALFGTVGEWTLRRSAKALTLALGQSSSVLGLGLEPRGEKSLSRFRYRILDALFTRDGNFNLDSSEVWCMLWVCERKEYVLLEAGLVAIIACRGL